MLYSIDFLNLCNITMELSRNQFLEELEEPYTMGSIP